MPEIEIGVRYCGGCNPTYNRASLVKRLESMMPDLSFVNVQPGKSYPAVLIVSGCLVACTKVDDLSVPGERQIQIRSFSDLLPTRDRIRELLTEEETLTLDRVQIESILPHRPPMLFVDSVSSQNRPLSSPKEKERAMTNLEKYDKAFIRLFKVKKEDLPKMKYMGDKKWDSMAHMDLMSDLEEIFDIQISTVDVLDFTDYNKGKIVLGRYGVEI